MFIIIIPKMLEEPRPLIKEPIFPNENSDLTAVSGKPFSSIKDPQMLQ